MSLNNSATAPNITAATKAVANLSGACHGLHTYLGQEAAINAVMGPVLPGEPQSFEGIEQRLGEDVDDLFHKGLGLEQGEVQPAHFPDADRTAEAIQQLRNAVRREVDSALLQRQDDILQTCTQGLTQIRNRVQNILDTGTGEDGGVAGLRTNLEDIAGEMKKYRLTTSSDINHESRLEAEKLFDESLDLLNAKLRAMQEADFRDAELQQKIDDCGSDDDEEATRLNRQASMNDKKRERALKAIVQHFGGDVRSLSGGKPEDIKLVIKESTLTKYGGQNIVPKFLAWIATHSDTYYVIAAYLRRICTDVDHEQQVHWQPPTKADRYARVPQIHRRRYAEQSEKFYRKLQDIIPDDAWSHITAPFHYGVNEQLEAPAVEEGDGPSALFALLSIYRMRGTQYIQSQLEIVLAGAREFCTGRPQNKISKIRDALRECMRVGKPLSWGLTGQPIRRALTARNNAFLIPLMPFDDHKITRQEDCGTDLDRMLTVIEREANKLENDMHLPKSDNAWTASVAVIGKQDLRDGFWQAKSFGKGKGKGGSKGRKGGKGKGSKGGRGKGREIAYRSHCPRCQIQGCIEHCDKADHEICNTHFNEARQKGSITKRNGEVFTPRRPMKRTSLALDSDERSMLSGLTAAFKKHKKDKSTKQPEQEENDEEKAQQAFLGQIMRGVSRS